MHQIDRYEVWFQRFITDLPHWLPDGLIEVDIKVLNSLNLLDFYQSREIERPRNQLLDQEFQVFETEEKITLINDKYAIWILPSQTEEMAFTCTMIARQMENNQIKLELCFIASGIYNYSKLVLLILEEYLKEIEQNDDAFDRFLDSWE